jgi:hypothetical protein
MEIGAIGEGDFAQVLQNGQVLSGSPFLAQPGIAQLHRLSTRYHLVNKKCYNPVIVFSGLGENCSQPIENKSTYTYLFHL